MHVLHVYKDYAPVLGGIEQHIGLLAPRQAARGMRVTVLVVAPRARDGGPSAGVTVEQGVEVIRVPRWATIASTPIAPGLLGALRRLRPDVTHVHAPYPPAELAQWCLGRRRPTVVYYHSDIVRQRRLKRLWLPLQARFLRQVDRILTSSDAYARSSPVLAALPGRVSVLPLGVDLERFAQVPRHDVNAVRDRFPEPRVLFVGRLRYYKGLDVLIDAMAMVPARLLVVGRGPMDELWRAHARASAAADRITFLGDVSATELAALQAAADVFVLPSTQRSEAFGLAQVEAMAAGTPVVSTQLGTGTSDVNQDGVSGFVVAPGDAAALADALRRVLIDPDLRRRMGREAQRSAARRFSIDTMVSRLEAVYRDVVSGARCDAPSGRGRSS